MGGILAVIGGFILWGIGYMVFLYVKEDIVEPKYNKFKLNYKVSKKYNLLFGNANWDIEDYDYNSDLKIGQAGLREITITYKITVRNYNSCPNNHLTEMELRELSKSLNKYDWIILIKYNQHLFREMEMYFNPNIFHEINPFNPPMGW